MKSKLTQFFSVFMGSVFLLSACSSGAISNPETAVTLPSPIVTVDSAPDARAAMTLFLEAYKVENYATMYGILSELSQDAISQEDFTTRYKETLNAISLTEIETEILSSLMNPYAAQVAFRVIYKTVLAGDITRDMVANLTLEGDQWHVQWDEGLIMPELIGGNKLVMDYRSPSRGEIYDRNGEPVVAHTDAVALGVIPGQINQETAWQLHNQLSNVTELTPEGVAALYENAGADWYVSVGETTADEAQRLLSANLGGLYITPYSARYYFNGGVAPQTIGYLLSISPEELEDYLRRGYGGDEKIGDAGLEKWGEEYLTGTHGGSLYVVNPEGAIITRLAQSDPGPSSSLHLTIDRELQVHAQNALRGFRGAAVVLERDTGRVLAMVSSPGFDPNLFEPTNANNDGLTALLSNTDQPLVNRATQGQYPLGSVFKVITFSAALSSGLYTADTTYACGYDFVELPDRTLHDWTWEHCQTEIQTSFATDPENALTLNTCPTKPSGDLTLSESLMRSCNPYYWHIGLDLYSSERTQDIANMARAFGLGQATGLGQVAESEGLIEDPTDAIQAVNQAIGQGTVLVTPLQVATFMAALGNGGTLYRPQVIESIQSLEGDATAVFKPEARSTLPLSPEYLQILQDAMISVIKDSRGTANGRLRGYVIPTAAKTGTAESGDGLPHAWFAGYTMAEENTGLPDIAIAVVLENAGEGSDFAAPAFRRIAESYYYGRPQSTYWFETEIGVRYTPTPFGWFPSPTPDKK
ncbi:MAG: hypothetical protein HN736_18155 [Anaerolineae bacterium]|jgi:penicillin-binding protein 2|nr:hypothetical protein [Anaerolineae bacterium]MBT3712043.1 hypothetical protein [Anaerolineae bacterium]MBT4308900.1 hypothetical protein [Anaerolineae bacterium]MBT4459051.1 hypothetical protein [Anaerolineae bacterium]MBT6061210.1 hypothetical protein [Anaerolineae bacterium]